MVIPTNSTVSVFWFRRVSEVTLFASLLIIAFEFTARFIPGQILSQSAAFGDIALILAVLTTIMSIIAMIWGRGPQVQQLSLASYTLLLATTVAVLISSNNLASPFVTLWVAVSIFAGIFGATGIAILAIAAVGYAVFLFTIGALTTQQSVELSIALVFLPLVISYFMWHRRTEHENEKDKAYSALARELSQMASKSDIVINAIADGVIAVDQKGVIQLINPAAQKLIGWSATDAVSLDYRSVLKLVNEQGETVDEDHDIVQQVLRTNITTSSNDFTILTNGGKSFLAAINVSPVGSLGSGAIIVFRDITQEVAEERQQAEFISTASHEMRTPVAAIEGYIGLALNPQTAVIDDKARAYLTQAHESAQHLGRLFQDLLDVSKAEDGRLSNNPQIIDVMAFARDMVMSLTPHAAEKGLAMVFKPDIDQIGSPQRLTPVFYINADADHLREVLNNLIENAIKYTKQGSVSVDIGGTEETVKISVHDTGLGIPPEDIPHLFQKFYRVDDTDTREIGGTGLGLYLSRRLTEAMDGHLSVESEYGKGSTFSVEFRRVTHEEATQRIEEQSIQQGQA